MGIFLAGGNRKAETKNLGNSEEESSVFGQEKKLKEGEAMSFKPTKFMSAEEKKTVLRDWKSFIKGDFDRKHFTKRLYDHLHLHCSFIAHFDIHGFYGTYFENPERTLKFLRQFDKNYDYKSTEYGTNHWFTSGDYHDLNSEMIYSLEPYKAKIYAGLMQKIKEMKMKQMEKLKTEIEELDR